VAAFHPSSLISSWEKCPVRIKDPKDLLAPSQFLARLQQSLPYCIHPPGNDWLCRWSPFQRFQDKSRQEVGQLVWAFTNIGIEDIAIPKKGSVERSLQCSDFLIDKPKSQKDVC
jgi:hypothetical protein